MNTVQFTKWLAMFTLTLAGFVAGLFIGKPIGEHAARKTPKTPWVNHTNLVVWSQMPDAIVMVCSFDVSAFPTNDYIGHPRSISLATRNMVAQDQELLIGTHPVIRVPLKDCEFESIADILKRAEIIWLEPTL